MSTRTPIEIADERGVKRRGAGIAGLAFVVLFVAGMMLSGGTPESNAPDQEWFDWFADSGNRTTEVVGMFVLAASGLCFVVFLAGMVRRIRTAGRRAGQALDVAWGAGLLAAGLIMVAAVAINQAAVGIEIGEVPTPDDADLLRMAEQAGFGIALLGGGWCAAVAVGALSWAGRRNGALPSWLANAGLVAAVILVFSIIWIPMVALPLWVLAASVTLLRPARAVTDGFAVDAGGRLPATA
jgi:hypothetical protein